MLYVVIILIGETKTTNYYVSVIRFPLIFIICHLLGLKLNQELRQVLSVYDIFK